MFTPKVSYASSTTMREPLMGVDNGSGRYTYECQNTDSYDCQDYHYGSGAALFINQ